MNRDHHQHILQKCAKIHLEGRKPHIKYREGIVETYDLFPIHRFWDKWQKNSFSSMTKSFSNWAVIPPQHKELFEALLGNKPLTEHDISRESK